MDEISFRNWLSQNKFNNKVISDTVSRLKRIEKVFDNCDIDEEYKNDECSNIITALSNNGKNEVMEKYPKSNLPVGKYTMSTYRYAVNIYLRFLRESD